MSRFYRVFSIVVVAALAVLGLRAVAQEAPNADRVVVELQDDGRALINPNMGWTMHFYSNITSNYGSRLEPSDALDWFEGCSVVYLRLP